MYGICSNKKKKVRSNNFCRRILNNHQLEKSYLKTNTELYI